MKPPPSRSLSFSPLAAKAQARRRALLKARRGGWAGGTQSFQQHLKQEARAARDLLRLVKWCNDKGYCVEFHSQCSDVILFGPKRITICTRATLQGRLASLLHECGHLLLNASKVSYNRRFGKGHPMTTSKDRRLKARPIHRIQVLEEEVEAWNRGRTLAARLRLRIDDQLWSALRFKNLATYVRWAAGKSPLAVQTARRSFSC